MVKGRRVRLSCLISLILFLVSFACQVESQTLHFKNYSVEDGLPFVQVFAIEQDSKGNLWIGGYGGLSRFDGKQFTNFSPKNGLANHWVTSIAEDSEGNIWAGTINGLSKYDGKEFRTFTTQDGLPGNYITSLAHDKDGRLLISTREGFAVSDGETFTPQPGPVDYYPSVNSTVYAGSDGTVWLSSDSGLCKLTPRASTVSTDKPVGLFEMTCGLYKGQINSIHQDRRGNLWLGTPGGVVKYDDLVFKEYTVNDGLPDNNVQSLISDPFSDAVWAGTPKGLARIMSNGQIENIRIGDIQNAQKVGKLFNDHEGNLWLGTFNGLYRHRDRAFITYADKDGVKNPFVYPVFRDRRNFLWVGTLEQGFYRFNGSQFRNFIEADGLIGTQMYSGMEDSRGNIWMGTNRGVCKYNGISFENFEGKKSGLRSDSVTSLLEDSRKWIWMGGNRGGTILKDGKFHTFNLMSTAGDFDVWYLFEDSDGNIWMGTYLGGLFRFEAGKDPSDSTAFENFSEKNNWKSESYLAIEEDKYGNLYFGSFEGIHIYNKVKKTVRKVTEKEGLSSDLVYVMSMDTAGNYLYVGTNQGINRLDVQEYHDKGTIDLILFGKEEGLSSIETNSNGIWRDPDNTFWLGTVNGLIHFNPSALRKNLIESTTTITGISIFYSDTNLSSGAVLPYNFNNLAFDYVGVCLTNPEKVRYKYRLAGLEKNWSPETSDRSARYPNLSPGSYTFQVISCNNEGIWNSTPATFEFRIRQPVWNTWWFRVISIISVIILGTIILKARAEAIRKKEASRMKQEIDLAQNELKALRAQMDPHFIFNSLSSIQGFIMNSDESSALKYLNKFSKLMRRMLFNSERNTVTLKEEIETISLYLELEALRWEGKFTYRIEVEPGLDIEEYKIPTLLIQPFVENAVIHGVVPRQNGGLIELMFRKTNEHIICSVRDNGIGRKQSFELKQRSGTVMHESMGVRITSERLEVLNKLHNSNMSVEIKDLDGPEGTGTLVNVFIPLNIH